MRNNGVCIYSSQMHWYSSLFPWDFSIRCVMTSSFSKQEICKWVGVNGCEPSVWWGKVPPPPYPPALQNACVWDISEKSMWDKFVPERFSQMGCERVRIKTKFLIEFVVLYRTVRCWSCRGHVCVMTSRSLNWGSVVFFRTTVNWRRRTSPCRNTCLSWNKAR